MTVTSEGAHTETHMASAWVHAEPLNVLLKESSGFKPTLFSRMRSYSETYLLPHAAPQATVNGDWPIPASGERPDSSDLEADIRACFATLEYSDTADIVILVFRYYRNKCFAYFWILELNASI